MAEVNELQAIVTGMLLGSLLRPSLSGPDAPVDMTVNAQYDDEGNDLPEFTVVGNVTGTVLRVKIEVEDVP